MFVCGPADATASPNPTSSLASFKSRLVFVFLVPVYPGCPGKEAVKRVRMCVKDVEGLMAQLDASRSETERRQMEVDGLRAAVEELGDVKRHLQGRLVAELTADVAKVAFLQKETSELREKIASMERLQALRNLRELEMEDKNVEETEKLRLELIEETSAEVNDGKTLQSGRRSTYALMLLVGPTETAAVAYV